MDSVKLKITNALSSSGRFVTLSKSIAKVLRFVSVLYEIDSVFVVCEIITIELKDKLSGE